ncbi:hypothetical protein EY05_14840, partial [Staphylococcus aureus]
LVGGQIVRSAVGAVRRHAGVGLLKLGFDALGDGRNGRADQRENQQSKANDCGGQNHPVNRDCAGFVFEERGKLGHW